ncbi:MAG: divergent PAP2 family protein [Bacteroidota bacterium]
MFANQAIISGIAAGSIAQLIKFVTAYIRRGRPDFRSLVTTGGMPSSHTALVMGLATSVGLQAGFHTIPFDISIAFAAIVMYDAAGVRQAAGKQAKVLNRIIFDLQNSLSFKEENLKELLGHTPREVIGGAILGIVVAFALSQF